MPCANSDITPEGPYSTWFDALIADHHAEGAASHPTKPSSVMDDLEHNRTPSCLLGHPVLRAAEEIFRTDPTRLQHLASEGKAPFFKRESLIKYHSPFVPLDEDKKTTPHFHGGVVCTRRDPRSQVIYTFEADPSDDKSYLLEVRLGSERPLRIYNGFDAEDPVFLCEYNDKKSSTSLYLQCRPNAPPSADVSYCSVTVPFGHYLGSHTSQDGHLRIDVGGHSQYIEHRVSGTAEICWERATSGPKYPSVSLAGETRADGQTSFAFKEGTEKDIETWATSAARKHLSQPPNSSHSVAL